MADAVLFALLFLAAAAAVALVRSALRYWWSERSGRVYELAQDRTGTALRAAAAGVAVLAVVAVAVPVLSQRGGGEQVPAAARTPVDPRAAAAPRAPAHAAAPPAAVSAAPRTISRPAGGVLQELADGTRVWTPPQYAYARAAKLSFPVVVVQLAGGDQELYAGFAAQVKRGLADSFLLVMPRACGTAAPDLTAVTRHYRTLTTRSARAILGVGARAACAVREAFAHPDRYRAVAAVSGTYEGVAVPARAPAGRRPALLLASGSGESAARDSALRFRTALHPRADEVRVIDGVSGRREVFARVAGYLTEKLDGPKRP